MRSESFSIGENTVHFTLPDISLPMGYSVLSQQFFRREIPSAYDVEMAIATIEDHIQATPQLHHNIASEFDCADEGLKQIARLAGAGDVISQSQIEQVFNRVADIISGSPKRAEEYPDDHNILSYLLIVRELSHHLNIQKINIIS